jgi:DNA-binding XRE family transcriptional regulator
MDPSTAIDVLCKSGQTETQIGERVGARQSTINRIRNRKMQPNYELGKALVDLASELEAGASVCPEERAGDGDAADEDGMPLQSLQRAA